MRLFALLLSAVSVLLIIAEPRASASDDGCGHWRFDDGAGYEIADSSRNDNIGFAKDASWVKGVTNSALQFEGSGWVNCGNDSSLNVGEQITMEAWVKPWQPNFPDFPTIVRKEGSYALTFAAGSKLAATLWLNGKETQLTSNYKNWPDSKWQHVAATFDGTTITLYINGQKDNEVAVAEGGSIDSNSAFCYIASVNGKRGLRATIDEVRVAARAFSPKEIKSSYDNGLYQLERHDSRFSAFFSKGERRVPKAVVPGFLWIDAEDFADYGGWWMDTQFVPQMGSPFLLAAGMGTPVADATTTVAIPEAGTYRLWVRNRNWLKTHSPGTFKVSVGGQVSSQVFGTADNQRWVWQDGGTLRLDQGETKIAISDLSGFYGRCDALILTTDLEYQPPEEKEAYKKERGRLTAESADITDVGHFDVIVVGAGVAGCNAAIAAARTGAKTALIQNRPMLGGNNSLELGVPVLGPADYGKDNARESGLNEEIGRERAYNFLGKWSAGADLVAAREKNLTMFLNTHVYDAEMADDKTIKAVRAFDMITDKRTRYTANVFIDCTGDGWLGYYAGAESMHGREASETFGESLAPATADNVTMSGSLFSGETLAYSTYDTGSSSPFTGPEWFFDFTGNAASLEARPNYQNSYISGNWWHENRGEIDDLWDPELARDGLVHVSLSYWNWIKNHSSLKEKAKNRKLVLIPIGNAKRETRRLVGDHVLKQDEVLRAEPFPDRVGAAGWGLDVHHPEGIFSTEGPFDFNEHTPMHNIPYRMLYSRNISNLLFAGRHVSTSHVALGTVRVQGTTGVMGQAAGTAAALCITHDTTPRGIYADHLFELQQQLLKDDQYIIDMKNEDPHDLALSATVTASSTMPGVSFAKSDVVPDGRAHELSHERSVMFPRGESRGIKTASLLLKSTNSSGRELTLRVRGANAIGDFSSETDVATATAMVPATGETWVHFQVNCDTESKYIWLMLPETEGIAWSMMKSGPLGSCRAYRGSDEKRWTVATDGFYAFHLDVPIRLSSPYRPENVTNGVTRIVGDQMNMWRSDPQQPMPQSLVLDLGEAQPLNTVYLTFDTDLNDKRHATWEMKESERFVPECVRNYELLYFDDGEWLPLLEFENNYQRRRIHRFPEVTSSMLKVVVDETNGDKSARIFEIRVYNE